MISISASKKVILMSNWVQYPEKRNVVKQSSDILWTNIAIRDIINSDDNLFMSKVRLVFETKTFFKKFLLFAYELFTSLCNISFDERG